MLTILAIGNSFSQDATTYLYDIANAAGRDCKIVNLYIGGCSLETHWNNIVNDAPLYEYELNGSSTGCMVSINETLLEEEWDYITLQQVSGNSGILTTYFPYITQISEYVRQYAPKAEQLLHQTWAYEADSLHPDFAKYNSDQGKMYEAIADTYQKLSYQLSLRIIPCGKVIQSLRSFSPFDYRNGGVSMCRDGFHMNLIYGRYALAATWFVFLFRQSVLDNSFLPSTTDGIPIQKDKIRLIRETVMQLVR